MKYNKNYLFVKQLLIIQRCYNRSYFWFRIEEPKPDRLSKTEDSMSGSCYSLSIETNMQQTMNQNNQKSSEQPSEEPKGYFFILKRGLWSILIGGVQNDLTGDVKPLVDESRKGQDLTIFKKGCCIPSPLHTPRMHATDLKS